MRLARGVSIGLPVSISTPLVAYLRGAYGAKDRSGMRASRECSGDRGRWATHWAAQIALARV